MTSGLLPTQPPGVTQQLVIRSLERALAGLYVHRFAGRSVDVAVFAQAGNEAFVKEFVMSWLKAHGVRTVSKDPVPEIALFKWVRHRGLTELRAFAFDAKTEDFVDQLPPGVGHAKSDDFTVLIFIGFSSSDLDTPVP